MDVENTQKNLHRLVLLLEEDPELVSQLIGSENTQKYLKSGRHGRRALLSRLSENSSIMTKLSQCLSQMSQPQPGMSSVETPVTTRITPGQVYSHTVGTNYVQPSTRTTSYVQVK